MSLVSMKRSGEQALQGVIAEGPVEEYPYGLCICLTEEEIAKLNLAMPSVGQAMELEAKVVVRSTSQNNSDSGVNRRIELQITDLELKTASSEEDDSMLRGAARVLYEMEDM